MMQVWPRREHQLVFNVKHQVNKSRLRKHLEGIPLYSERLQDKGRRDDHLEVASTTSNKPGNVPRQSLYNQQGTAKEIDDSEDVGHQPSKAGDSNGRNVTQHDEDHFGHSGGATAPLAHDKHNTSMAAKKPSGVQRQSSSEQVPNEKTSERYSERLQDKEGRDNQIQDISTTSNTRGNVPRLSLYNHPSTAKPLDDSEDVGHQPSQAGDSNGRNVTKPGEDYLGHPGGAAAPHPRDQLPTKTAAAHPRDQYNINTKIGKMNAANDQHINEISRDDDAPVGGNVKTPDTTEGPFNDCFVTVDKMKYQYWATNYIQDRVAAVYRKTQHQDKIEFT